MPAEVGPDPRPIALEIIVKFVDDSDAGRSVLRAFDGNGQDPGELADVRDQLHRATGWVLTPERVTSGRELVIRIPERPLLETVMQTVAQRPEVSSAKLVAIQNENPHLPENLLLLQFDAAGRETELLQKAYGEEAYAEPVQELAVELCAESGVPVLGSPASGAALAVTVDRFALLDTLVARLKSLDYVDYAQPNSTLQFMK